MTKIQALILGLLQGITEFLPISSKGHLVIVQQLMGYKDNPLFFDVMLHLGTTLVVLVYFRRDILALIGSLMGRDSEGWPGTAAQGRRVVLWIIIGTIPAAAAGVLFKHILEPTYKSSLYAGFGLLVTATVLAIADRISVGEREAESLGPVGSLIVGVGQAFALLPGISRSGSTICASIFMKLNRRDAARYSFLLSVVAILGAAVMELKEAHHTGMGHIHMSVVLIGVVASFVSGLFALNLLVRVLTRGRLIWFAAYCAFAGIAAIAIGVLIG